MEFFIQQTVNAISLGGTYALLALGLAVVFSILGMINFAHGELMTITGYSIVGLLSIGFSFWLSVPIAILAAMCAAIAMERLAFRPFRGANGAVLLITSFSISVILQVLFQNLISARPKAIQLPPVFSTAIEVGGVTIGIIQTTSIVVTISMLIFLIVFLNKTMMGKAIRAAAEDFSVTRLMGIRANRVIATAFAISGLLAGVAGILWIAQRSSVAPTMGFIPVLKAFIAAILGGLGSLSGAVAGGLLLGAIEIYLSAYLPDVWLPFRDAIALGAVILILLVRPHGLFPPPTAATQRA